MPFLGFWLDWFPRLRGELCIMQLRLVFSWVVKAALALSLVYSVLFGAEGLGVTFFRLVHGGMVKTAVTNVVFSESLDCIIWACIVLLAVGWLVFILLRSSGVVFRQLFLLFVSVFFVVLSFFLDFGFVWLTLASIFVVLLSVRFSKTCFGVSSLSMVKSLILYFMVFLLFVEVASLASFFLLSTPVGSVFGAQYLDWAWHWMFLDLSLWNVTYPLLPLAYLFFVFLGVAGVLIKIGGLNAVVKFSPIRRFVECVRCVGKFFAIDKNADFGFLSGRLPLIVALVVSVAVSCLLVVFTVLPWINFTYRLVSVDAPLYYSWLHDMHAADFGGALSLAFASDRSVFMIALYLLSLVVSPLHLVQFLPLLLIPLFSVFSLLLVKLFGSSHEALVFAVLLAPLSTQALGLIFSGYFAHMSAILLVCLYFVIFLGVLRKRSRFDSLILTGVSVLILFAHPWTWFIFAMSLTVFLFIQWCSAIKNQSLWQSFKVKANLIAGPLLVSLLCGFVGGLLSETSTVAIVYETVRGSLAFPSTSLLWSGMSATANLYLGGAFGNPLLVFLSIVGFLFVVSRRSDFSDLLVSWVFIASTSILLTGSEFAYHKFLFSMPLVVFSSLGLSYFIRFVAFKSDSSRIQNFKGAVLILAVVFLMLLCSGLRFVSNIVMF